MAVPALFFTLAREIAISENRLSLNGAVYLAPPRPPFQRRNAAFAVGRLVRRVSEERSRRSE